MTFLKLISVPIVVLAICYQTNVNCFDDDYTLFVSHKFDVGQRELYRFVTMPELVDRWIKWLPFFMAADFKPLGVGKHFMIFSNDFEYILKVTEYEAGKFLTLESELFLRPKIELVFSEENEEYNRSGLEIRMNFQRTSALFQHTVGRLYRRILEQKLIESLDTLHGILSNLPKTRCCSCACGLGTKLRNSICLL